MSRRSPRLGKVQFQIMEVLWQRGPSTAREITEELSRAAPVAHSTVQTLLRQLEAKDVVSHEVKERTFVYHPLLQPSEMTATPLHELLVRVYRGSVYNLMSHLLKHERVSPEELARLRELLDEVKQDENSR